MSVLEEICAKKRGHIKKQESLHSLESLKEKIKTVEPPRGFIEALKNASNTAIITEVKKASPSKGVIRQDFDPQDIAKIYEDNSSTCISVLTDTPYFQGRDEDLTAVKNTVNLPVLRKDFMLDPYQIYESRALGADCILIIMAALDDETAKDLHDLSTDLGMDVLVEIHDRPELDRALQLNPQMIGVNNRNLKTLQVDVQTSFDLLEHIPQSCIKVAESGISESETIQNLKKHGYDAFLIGESLMRTPDIAKTLQELLSDSQ